MEEHTFTAIRDGAHHAAQVASALGATHGTGDVHERANLGWDLRQGALVGHEVHGLRAGLRLHDLAWLLVRGTEVVASKHAAGHPLDDGFFWLRRQAHAHSEGQIDDRPAEAVGYDLPDHPVTGGASFAHGGQDHLATLARWFATSAVVLEGVRRRHDGASPVRCWPHHFDLATLITLDDGDDDPERARTVGVGMTPGDGGIDGPYVYVTPWPYPEPRVGPPLPGQGHWHVEGWFGAVLQAGDTADPDDLLDFVESAVEACHGMLR